jgi:preprotein translocase subunit SecE
MRIVDYIRDTKAELKHVSWPTRRQAIVYTVIVILISVGVSFYLGLFDALFSFGLEKVVL